MFKNGTGVGYSLPCFPEDKNLVGGGIVVFIDELLGDEMAFEIQRDEYRQKKCFRVYYFYGGCSR